MYRRCVVILIEDFCFAQCQFFLSLWRKFAGVYKWDFHFRPSAMLTTPAPFCRSRSAFIAAT